MDISEITQFEKHLENTMMGVLSAACKNVYRSRMADTNASPRISFKAIIGGQFQNQKLPIAQAPGWIYSSYDGRIESTVATNRTSESDTAAHDILLGQARLRHHQFYVTEWEQAQPGILPVLIFDIRPAENEDAVADTENLDTTKLTHSILFCINQKALPYS